MAVEIGALRALLSLDSAAFERGVRQAKQSLGGMRSEFAQTSKSAASSAAVFGNEMDRLRNKFDPLYAASKKYEAELDELNRAHRMGAVSTSAYEAQLESLSQQYLQTGSASRTLGRANTASAASTANLAAQFNDIGVMLAAGQNPLMLAVQQGTQVNQVLDQVGTTGKARLSALASSFMSVVSPANLLTLGVIAGGAALIQWGVSAATAGQETTELQKRIEQARQSTSDLKLELRGLRLGIDQNELALLDAIAAKRANILEIEEDIEAASGRNRRAAEIRLENEQAALSELESQLSETQRLTDEKEVLLQTTQETADAERMLGEQLAEAARQAAVLAANMASARDSAMEAAREFMTVQRLRSRFAGEEAVMSQDVLQVGRGEPAPTVARVSRSRGGGGSRRSSASSGVDRERNKMLSERDSILNSLKTAQDEYNESVAQADRLLSANVLSQEAYTSHLNNLKAELQQSEFGELISGIEDVSDAMAGAIVDGENLGDSLRQVFKSIVRDFAASGIKNMLSNLFNLGGGGGGSGLGKIFAGFFDNGGNIPSGQFGIAGENGPEIVQGPARVTSRRATARVLDRNAAQKVQVELVNPTATLTDDGKFMATVDAKVGRASQITKQETLAATPGYMDRYDRQYR